MKLIGFNKHYIENIHFTYISQAEMKSLLKYEDEERNIQITESVEIGIAEGFKKAKITAEIQLLDIEDLRKIGMIIVGFFEIDNESIEDGEVVSDFVYKEGWPILKEYVKPAISTILNISNTGQLDMSTYNSST